MHDALAVHVLEGARNLMDVPPNLLLGKSDLVLLSPLHDQLQIALFGPLHGDEELVQLVFDKSVQVLDDVGVVERLVELHFLQTVVPLLFVVHVKNLDQLQSDDALVVLALCLKDIGELALAWGEGSTYR